MTTLAIPFFVIASTISGIIIEKIVLGRASPSGCNSLGRFFNPNSSTVLPRACDAGSHKLSFREEAGEVNQRERERK